jgi:putative acetyltransferase
VRQASIPVSASPSGLDGSRTDPGYDPSDAPVTAALVIGVDDPRAPDVRAVIEAHLAFAHDVTPTEHVHALGLGGLLDPAVTFFAARQDGGVAGIGAIKELDRSHAELKSMHTVVSARGQGIGRAMVDHLLDVAVTRGYQRVSLETGTQRAFAPARTLYRTAGFTPCEPFGEYTANAHSICMTMELLPAPARRGRSRG